MAVLTTNVEKFWNSRCEEEQGSQNGITNVLLSTEGPGTTTSFEMESVGSQVMAFSPIVLRKKDSEQTGNGRIDLILEASNQVATEGSPKYNRMLERESRKDSVGHRRQGTERAGEAGRGHREVMGKG